MNTDEIRYALKKQIDAIEEIKTNYGDIPMDEEIKEEIKKKIKRIFTDKLIKLQRSL